MYETRAGKSTGYYRTQKESCFSQRGLGVGHPLPPGQLRWPLPTLFPSHNPCKHRVGHLILPLAATTAHTVNADTSPTSKTPLSTPTSLGRLSSSSDILWTPHSSHDASPPLPQSCSFPVFSSSQIYREASRGFIWPKARLECHSSPKHPTCVCLLRGL